MVAVYYEDLCYSGINDWALGVAYSPNAQNIDLLSS